MKLCITCAHYRCVVYRHECVWGLVELQDFVVGGTRVFGTPSNCYNERSLDDPSYCGPQGKNWEAKDAQATA